jgi:calcium permeable stress-gated cation channel
LLTFDRYVFSTKHESGGLYWRTIFNRFLTGAFLSNCIIALMVGARGSDITMMLAAMAPLPFLLIGFKFYCRHTFDLSMRYYSQGNAKGVEATPTIDKERKRDRVAVRFGHPALYQKLTVPMVSEKSKHLLADVYRGRLDGDVGGSGFSDVYLKRMSKENPGKYPAETTTAAAPFEFVSESNMDYENYKNRHDFADDGGSIYSGPSSRPGTPSIMGGHSRDHSRGRSRDRDEFGVGVTYPEGYHSTPSALREMSPSPSLDGPHGLRRLDSQGSTPYEIPAERGLLGGAAPMGGVTGTTPGYTPEGGETRDYFGTSGRR